MKKVERTLRLIPVDITDEIPFAEDLARRRVSSNQKAGVREQKFAQQSSLDINLQGMFGEVALSKVLGVPVDTSVHPRHGGSDLVCQGYSIDVKCPLIIGGNLIVKDLKRLEDTNIYILVEGRPPLYFVVGYSVPEEIFNLKNLKIDRRGNRYYLVGRCDLHTLEDAFVEQYYSRYPEMREEEKQEKYEFWEAELGLV